MNLYDFAIGSFVLRNFINWINVHESKTTEIAWYDLDGCSVSMDVGYFFEALSSFEKYFEKRIKECKE